MQRQTLVLAALLSAMAFAGCGNDDDGDDTPEPTIPPGTALIGIDPLGGAVNIGTDETITLIFNGAMDPAPLPLVDLHATDIAGPTIPMDCAWHDGDRRLVCGPRSALSAGSTYVIHLAGAGFRTSEGELATVPTGPPLNGASVVATDGALHAGQPFGSLEDGWEDAAGRFGTSFTFDTKAALGS